MSDRFDDGVDGSVTNCYKQAGFDFRIGLHSNSDSADAGFRLWLRHDIKLHSPGFALNFDVQVRMARDCSAAPVE